MAGEDSDTGIKIYLREIGQIPLLTPQEEIDLAARIKKGDREARALMIKANLRLVVKIAHDYANLGLPLLDLVSEGNIGLMKAVERFDPAKGGKLSTYAAWWIKQSIKRALANQSKTIRLPVHLVDKISKMRRVSLQMSEELGREPTDDELAEEIGISSGKVSQLKTVSIRPASLDAPISDDDSTEFGEIVGDEEAQTPFELLSAIFWSWRIRSRVTPNFLPTSSRVFGLPPSSPNRWKIIARSRSSSTASNSLTSSRRFLSLSNSNGV